MSELLDKIKAKGDEVIGEKGPDAIEKLLDKARRLIDVVDEEESPVPVEVRDAGLRVIDALDSDEVREKAVRLGQVGFARIVGLLEDDQEEEAARLYVATKATFAERRRWVHEKVLVAATEPYDSWRVLREALMAAGKIGLQALAAALIPGLGL